MTGLVMAAQLLLALGLLVFIHELGHFLAARAFGIRVEKFFIFFDFNGVSLFSKKIGDTEYGIGWFPLGGYVKIAGMIDESMDTEQMKKPPEPWEFRSKPPWQRFIVMVAGITMNVLLGIFIFTMFLSHYSREYIDPTTVKDGIYAYKTGQSVGFRTGDHILAINGKEPHREVDLVSMALFLGAKVLIDRNGHDTTLVLSDTLIRLKAYKDAFIALNNYPFDVDSVPGKDKLGHVTPAAKIGLQHGDSIVAINNEKVAVFGDVRSLLMKYDSTPVKLDIKRNGQLLSFKTDTIKGAVLGFTPSPSEPPYATIPYTLPRAFHYGLKDGFETIYYQAVGFSKLLTGKVPVRDSLTSPIGIGRMYGGVWDWKRFWYLTGLISFILAFMNILPIPALDGGHVVFIVVEVIQGKPVGEKFLENAQKVGIAILLALMVFAFGNDIVKLIFK